jgi:transposase
MSSAALPKSTSATPLPESLPAAHELIQDLQARLQQADWQIAQLRKTLYGPTSERVAESELSPEQVLLSLFPPAGPPPATQDVLQEEVPKTQSKSGPARTPRQPALRELETVSERIEPAEMTCPHCGKAKCEIGCERTERFEYIPAKVIRHEIVRPRMACPCGQGTVMVAPLPPAPIDKGMPGPGLLAQVVLAKYDDHLPLYRQEQQFTRLGVCFPRQRLCDWIEGAANLVQLVVHRMKANLLAGDYLQVDETPVKVMDPEVKGKCATGYLWVAGRPGGDVLFEFHPGRSKAEALKLLGGFGAGYLQRDGYGVYGSIVAERPDLVPVGCGAHLRRKFVDALADDPVQSNWFIDRFRSLYFVERHARTEAFTPEQRLALRQEKSRPVVDLMAERLETLAGTSLLPQSPLGKALSYARNEWVAWTRFLQDGRLEIDNNLTENALRPSCLGKRNWLFLGHPDAGWRSAHFYSLIASCRRRAIDPWEYLRDLFARLPTLTNQQFDEVLPANWKPRPK